MTSTTPTLTYLKSGLLALVALGVLSNANDAQAARCLFVSSYHQGYAWSDGVERGLRSVLQGKCEIKQFDMDTKRRKSEDEKQKMALEAKALIESWQPDVVITADDNAAKYLIKPYFRDHEVPFVFCGVNWTVKEYEFPYTNVTGMIEVAPIRPMLQRAAEIVPGARRAFYIGAHTLTEEKNVKRFQEATESLGMEMEHALVDTTEQWLAAYRRAQDHDFVIVGSKAGINDWDSARIQQGVLATVRRLSVTNHGWMMPYTIFGVTKVPEEHGEWAAKSALEILDGTSPQDIRIVANRKRDFWINESILRAAELTLSPRLMRKAKKVDGLPVQF